MAKRQKLIHLHSGGLKANRELIPSSLEKGEIAVRHANEEPELYIRKEDDTLATFIDEKAISKKITDVTDVISAKLEALSGATEDLVSTVVGDYVTSGSLEGALEELSNDINATIETLSGRVDAHDIKFTTLEKNIDEYKDSVSKTYVTKSEYGTHEGVFNAYTAATDSAITDITKDGGLIDDKVSAAKKASSAYTDAEIDKVEKLIDAEKARINTLEENSATKVELVAVSGLIETTFNAKIDDITKDGGAIDTAVAAAKVASSAYTDAEIDKVEKLIDAEKARIDVLEASAATKEALASHVNAFTAYTATTNQAITDITKENGTIDTKVAAAKKASSAYTDAEIAKVKSDVIAPLETKVTTLIGEDSGKTARAIAEDVVKFVVSGASSAFDTLKEVEDWIVKDEEGTADLIQTVTDLGVIATFASGHTVELAEDFDDFKALVGETYVTKSEYATHESAFTAYTAATDNAITDITKDGGEIDTKVAAAKVASSAYTDAEIDKVEKLIDAEKARIDVLEASAATKEALASHVNAFTAYTAATNQAIEDITKENGTIDTKVAAAKKASSAYTDAEIAKVKSDVIAPLDARVDSLESISGLSYTAIHEIDYNVISGNGFSVKTAQIESATTGATLSMEFDLSELVIDCGEF